MVLCGVLCGAMRDWDQGLEGVEEVEVVVEHVRKQPDEVKHLISALWCFTNNCSSCKLVLFSAVWCCALQSAPDAADADQPEERV